MPVLLPQKPRVQPNYRNRLISAPPRRVGTIPPRAVVVPESIEWLGQGIVYFTMFYCSMNWLYYRNLRKDLEAFKEEQQDKKDKK